MAKLVLTCLRGARAGARFEVVEADCPVTMGRRPDNTIAFDPEKDSKSSGRHADIRVVGGRFVLNDLGSTNGTFVVHGGAETRVAGSVALADGMNVELGKGGPVLSVRLDLDDGAEVPNTSFVDVGSLPLPEPPPPAAAPGARTAVYQAMMVETAKKSAAPLKWMIGIMATLLVGSGVGFYFYWRYAEDEKDTLRREQEATKEELGQKAEQLEADLDKTKEKLTEAQGSLKTTRDNLAGTSSKLLDLRVEYEKAEGDAKKKLEEQTKALEKTKTEYEAQLKKQEEALKALEQKEQASEVIAKKYEKSLFMLIAVRPDTKSMFGFCTAFAAHARGVLATNAHCARAMTDMNDKGLWLVARMNRSPEKTYPIKRWKGHADYKGSAFSTDVAIVEIDLRGDTMPAVPALAPSETLYALAPGQAIYTIGFPGKVMNEQAPAADFRAAVISRLTNFQNQPGTTTTTRMVWHSALTSKGTSGSPIFNAKGDVVAVNNGGLSARSVNVADPVTGGSNTEVAYDATGLNFGVRADALKELLDASW